MFIQFQKLNLSDKKFKNKIDFPTASLNRLVVLRQFQGQGLSDKLDKIRFEKAQFLKCQSICIMSYGKRSVKLLDNGFRAIALLKLPFEYETEKESARDYPPTFYIKNLEII